MIGLAKGPLTAAELAARTNTNERYIREWLANQAAGGYAQYEAAGGKYSLSEEQALCLANPNGPVDLSVAYATVEDLFHVKQPALENFRTGKGMEWGEHHACLFHGTERFFRVGYNANLLSGWLPALEGVPTKLGKARAQPMSDAVTARAAAAGVTNVRFETADAVSHSQKDLDLIAFFDCLLDMADPSGAARHARAALKPDGTCMLVEPMAGDRVEDNLNPVGRVYYGASSLICVLVSLARRGPALGAQAGEKRLRKVVVEDGGFTRFRRATETPFNIVLEARP
jgi:SAM-dependent methyltransferase